MSERIDKTGIQQGSHFFSFLQGKAGVAAVGFCIFQIDLLMRDIQIPANNNRFYGVQLLKIASEPILPFQSVRQSRQIALGIGRIDIHQIKGVKLQRDDSPFLLLLLLQYVMDRERL